jgi:uncharacterized protein YodC (DUF2158 family)
MSLNVVSLAPKVAREPAGSFAVGDVVQLRSGDGRMTVRKFHAAKAKTAASVEVDWLNGSADPITCTYPVAMLDLVLGVEEVEEAAADE